jgi:hypothetical protein
MSFQDLAEMIRSGTLKEDDPVRREGGSGWTAAQDVIGLLRAAGKQADEQPAPAAGPERAPLARKPAKPARSFRDIARSGWSDRRLRNRVLVFLSGVLMTTAAAVVWAYWPHSRPTFPEPLLGRPRRAEDGFLTSALGPRPEIPSVPGLEPGVPQPIPGLEKIEPAFAPSLAADLESIVFSRMVKVENKFDLYLAARDDVSDPFGEPKLIERCASPQEDTHPTLSPDGLELIFVRAYARPILFHAARETTFDEFRKPIVWSAPGLENAGRRFGLPRFVDRLHLMISATEGASNTPLLLLAQRARSKRAFGPPREWPFWTPADAFITPDGLRAYYGSQTGLSVMVRTSPAAEFQGTIEIADAAVTGPINGPVWVAPREDVMFYASPGTGKNLDSPSRLWMIRF